MQKKPPSCSVTIQLVLNGTDYESASLVAQSCPTLCDPMDCSLPGSSVHGIFQARVLEWVAISFSRGSSWPRDLPHRRQTLCRLSHHILWIWIQYFRSNSGTSSWWSIPISSLIWALLLVLFSNFSWVISSMLSTAAAAAKSLQLCPTLCNPTDGSPPGFPVPGILQARTLEWVAISFSNAWKWKVKVKSLSCVWLLATPWTAANQAPPSMGFSRQKYFQISIASLTSFLVNLNVLWVFPHGYPINTKHLTLSNLIYLKSSHRFEISSTCCQSYFIFYFKTPPTSQFPKLESSEWSDLILPFSHIVHECSVSSVVLDSATPQTVVQQPPLCGIFQARLEWVAISSSRRSSRPRDEPPAPAWAGRFFTAEPPGKPLPILTICQVILI